MVDNLLSDRGNEIPVSEAPDFRDLASNQYESVSDRLALAAQRTFQFTDDASFDATTWLKTQPAYAPYSGALIKADPKSEEELKSVYANIIYEQNRAEEYHNASGLNKVMAMVVDPTNAIPQIKLLKALKGGKGLIAGSAESAATAIGIEAANSTLDAVGAPDFSAQEAIIQATVVGAGTFAFSLALGGAGHLYADAVQGAYRNNRDRFIEIMAMERMQELAMEGPTIARANRVNGGLTDEDLIGKITLSSREVSATQNVIDEMEGVSDLSPDDAFKLDNLQKARAESSRTFEELMTEKANRLADEATVDGVVDAYSLVGNFNPIPTPFAKILRLTADQLKVKTDAGLNMLKKATHELASSQANITVGQAAGLPLRGSVHTNATTDRRTWADVRNTAMDAFAEDKGKSTARLMGLSTTDLKARATGGQTFKNYYNEAFRKRIFGEAASTPAEKRTMDAIEDFYSGWAEKRTSVGQIGQSKRLTSEINVVELRLVKLDSKLKRFQREATDPNISKRNLKTKNKAIKHYEKRIAEQNEDLARYKSALETYESNPIAPSGVREPFANRLFDTAAVERNLDRFKSIISRHFRDNGSFKQYDPKTKTMTRKDLTGMSEEEIDDAVQRVIDSILNDSNVMVEGADFLDNVTSLSRQLDLGNKDLWEFIHHDADYLMQKYVETSAPNFRFAELNNSKTPKQVWEEIEDQLVDDGHSKASIDMMRLNYGVLEERVMRGTQLRDPSRWDNRSANFLKQFTTLNYLTKSGMSSMPEFSRIISEHSLGEVFKGLGRMFIDPEFRKAMGQAKTEFGDASELAMGSFHQVYSDGMSRQVNPDDVWGKINQSNHILNMLGPISEFFKTFDAAMRQHTLVDYMEKTLQGRATEFESAYLNRYNISVKDMRNIMENAPIQKNGSFTLSNIDQWEISGVPQQSIQKFRSAVQAGISNTIVAATPADKPIFVDGVMFVKKSTLKNIPWARAMKEDSKYKGYVRMESGVGTLPFQFQSVVMAGMNKTLGAYTSGMVRNRYAGAFSGMALGYLTLWSKTPDYIWDEMTESDRFARAFDYASLAPLYSTMVYDSISAAQLTNSQAPFGGLITPKFTEDKNILDAGAMLGGPAASTAIDAVRAISDVLVGDFSEGASGIRDMVPLVDTLLVKTITDQFTPMLE